LTKASAASENAVCENEARVIEGELQVGRKESVILCVGMERGDYAGYYFTNNSKAGRAILAACKTSFGNARSNIKLAHIFNLTKIKLRGER
jgi:hypothetical protein